MNNTKELRDELVDVFKAVKSGQMDTSQGKTLVAASNSMLKSAQLELEHSKLIGQKKVIKFLETE